MANILGNHNSLFNQFIAEVRDEKIQKDSMRSVKIWNAWAKFLLMN